MSDRIGSDPVRSYPRNPTIRSDPCTSLGITHSLIKFKINFWWTKLTQMECGTNSAVHRPKPGHNLVIRAGFLFHFFCSGWVTGCLFLQRDPARVQAVPKKIVTPVLTGLLTRVLTWVLTQLQPDFYLFLPMYVF